MAHAITRERVLAGRGVLLTPKTFAHWRIHALAVTILDTGCRIDEPLNATVRDFDFDNLLLTVLGKGRKERRVPMSIELRKVLYRFGQIKERAEVVSELMFPARESGVWHQRNALRSYYSLLKRLGLRKSGFHLLRLHSQRNTCGVAGKSCGCRSSSGTPKCRPR